MLQFTHNDIYKPNVYGYFDDKKPFKIVFDWYEVWADTDKHCRYYYIKLFDNLKEFDTEYPYNYIHPNFLENFKNMGVEIC